MTSSLTAGSMSSQHSEDQPCLEQYLTCSVAGQMFSIRNCDKKTARILPSPAKHPCGAPSDQACHGSQPPFSTLPKVQRWLQKSRPATTWKAAVYSLHTCMEVFIFANQYCNHTSCNHFAQAWPPDDRLSLQQMKGGQSFDGDLLQEYCVLPHDVQSEIAAELDKVSGAPLQRAAIVALLRDGWAPLAC